VNLGGLGAFTRFGVRKIFENEECFCNFEVKIPLKQASFPSLFMDIPLWKAKSPFSE